MGAQHLGVHGDGRRDEGDVAGLVSAAQPGLAPADGAELLSQLLHLPGEVSPPRAGQHGETVTLYMDRCRNQTLNGFVFHLFTKIINTCSYW